MKEPYDPVAVVAANLQRLMDHEKDRKRSLWTDKAVGKASSLGHGTVYRTRKGSHAIKIDNLQAIADAFGLKAWQLLIPGLEPDNPPMIKSISPTEAKLYEDLQKLAAKITQAKKS